ncbi:MAG: LysR family transcriptional regulator [Acidimicrobiales bacterium]
MDLRQLSALLSVADHGSFSAAARALHTVQSNVSTHIARLERELGVTLVDRSAGALTEEGELVAERARRVRSELEALSADVASVRDEVSGSARIGMIGTTARWLAPRLLDALTRAHPRIRLVVVDATTSTLMPQLLRGDVDIAVANLPTRDPDVIEEPLFDEDRLLVAPRDHPLASFEELSIDRLADYELVLASEGTVFRSELDADADRAGVVLRTKAEVDGMTLVASLAFQGFGPAILPASAVPSAPGPDSAWRRIPVRGLSRRKVGLVRRRRGMPAAPTRAVANVLKAVVAESAPHQPGIHPAVGAEATRVTR